MQWLRLVDPCSTRTRRRSINGILVHGAYTQSATGRSAPSPTPRRKARIPYSTLLKKEIDLPVDLLWGRFS